MATCADRERAWVDVAELRANGQDRSLGTGSVLVRGRAKMPKAILGSMGGDRKGVK